MATDHKGRAEHWRTLEREALTAAVEAADEATKSRLLAIASGVKSLGPNSKVVIDAYSTCLLLGIRSQVSKKSAPES